MELIAVVVTTLFFHISSSAPTVRTHVTDKNMDFLERNGYLAPPNARLSNLMSEDTVSLAIKKLQRFGNIKVTGVMNKETETLIETPRCGIPDLDPSHNSKRSRRWTHQGSSWTKRTLTWRYADENKNNDGLSDTTVRETIRKSCKKWSDETNLIFKEITTGTPDIWFRFVTGDHQDLFPFDDRNGTLAHSFYPHDNIDIAGDIHFNDAQRFTLDSKEGRNLLWITVHELGHSIGLDHSNKREAIMYPWYQKQREGKDFDLTADDIQGIRGLYGVKEKIPTSSPCTATDRIQAVILRHDKKTYVINKNQVFVLRTNLGIEKGPLPVDNYFKGLTSVDAAFTRHGGKETVFFSRNKYYVFQGRKLVSGPRQISEGFSGLPIGFSNINAAFIYPKNKVLYIFSGSSYYRFSYERNVYVKDNGYPRPISSAWKNIPNDVDAVFTWRNGRTYFFKGSKYYRLSNSTIDVDSGYPKDIASYWTPCPDRR